MAFDNQALAGQTPEDTIVHSNGFLSIGIQRETGKAFVEEKNSGEVWIWDWRQIIAADLSSFFSRGQKSLKPLEPYTIVPTADGFALEFREPWGRFLCSVELADNDVLFRVEPDGFYPCGLGAIRFPPTLCPENGAQPIMLDTVNGGRLHRPSSRRMGFSVPAEECWMR